MKTPTSRKEVRKFIGVINYYRYMCPSWLHTLAPLTRLTYITKNFKCKQVKQDTFDDIKQIMACNNLLTYPDFNETFKIHTSSRAFKLGAVIIHKGKYIAF